MLTGGLGYIGSHVAVRLVAAGYEVVLYDSLINSRSTVLEKVASLSGAPCVFVEGDVRDQELLKKTLKKHSVDAVIHLAGLKAVGESAEAPLSYYSSNVGGSLSLAEAMASQGVRTLIFSSSATVYGVPKYLPMDEGHPTSVTNPYGRTKLHIEEFLSDVVRSKMEHCSDAWSITCLRYFNPVGAHESGALGERGTQAPNNLMPTLLEVARSKRSELVIHGDDFETPDGTGVRDYIHVMDLAEGHVAALEHLRSNMGFHVYNLGTGTGYSVGDVVATMERVSGITIPTVVGPRREGDVAICYADAQKAQRDLKWVASRGIDDMCLSAWQARNF